MLSILHTNWYVNTNGVNINDEDELIEHLLGEMKEQNNLMKKVSWMCQKKSE